MKLKSLIKSSTGVLALFSCLTFAAGAQNTTHTVEKGETLFSIANKYDVNVQQLKEWNNIDANNLSIGDSLVIKQPADEEAIKHTVEKQETLFSISKQHNVSIAEIKEWNNLSTNNVEVGQELIIYPSSSAERIDQPIVVDSQAESNTYYMVKSGDSLYRIAEQHDMTVDELKALNNLSNNNIRVGQQLTVRDDSAPPSVASSVESSPQGKFVNYEISGEPISREELLEKFQMDEEEFSALNPNANSSTFQPGRELTLLAPPSKNYQNPYLSNRNLQDLGTAVVSQYRPSEKAQPTTSGDLYNPNALTAAHSNISLGTVIFIENPENKKGTYVRVNDRSSGNGLKLSAAAWNLLDFNSSSPKVTIYQNQ